MNRPRTNSNWKTIRVIDDFGNEQSSYELDNLGKLQEKLGRQKNRRLKKSKLDAKIPTSTPPQIMGGVYSINDSNKVNQITNNIIDEDKSININTKQSLNLNLDSKVNLITKEDQNPIKDNYLDFPLDFFVKDDFFNECGDALENFYDVGNLFNDQETLECEPIINFQF